MTSSSLFAADMRSVTIWVPVRLVSEMNTRGHEHWRVRAKRAKSQMNTTAMVVGPHLRAFFGCSPEALLQGPGAPRIVVHMVRIGPRELDSDNIASSFKSPRDAIAALLGIDDADPRIEWTWNQRKGRAARRGVPAEYACEVTVTRIATVTA